MNGEKREQSNPQSNLDYFYEECMEMSIRLEQSLNKRNWFKANSE